MNKKKLGYIYKLEVSETILPKKMNWLGDYEEEFDDDDFDGKRYELFFSSFGDMDKKIDELTVGFQQYWADVHSDLHDNNVEYLEYHNTDSNGEWDKEVKFNTSRLYLTESFWDALNKFQEKGKLK
ncbi:hypothetical protein ACI3ER_11455 [Bacillus sp. Wb]